MRMRKKRNGQKRLRMLSSIIFTDPAALAAPSSVFAADLPLRLEIGCGKGDFICGISEKEPDYNYIAMEKVDDVIVIAAEKYARLRGLGTLAPNGGFITSDGTLYRDDDRYVAGLACQKSARRPPSQCDATVAQIKACFLARERELVKAAQAASCGDVKGSRLPEATLVSCREVTAGCQALFGTLGSSEMAITMAPVTE